MFRDAAISLSLANLCFVKVWGKALSGAGAYFTEFKIAYGAILLDVLLLATIFFVSITLVRRLGKPHAWQVARWAYLAAMLTAINGIALLSVTLSGINFSTLLGRSSAYFLGVIATAGLVVVTIVLREKVLRFSQRALLLLLPFVVITFSQALFKLVQNVGVVHAASERTSISNVPHQNPASRVLWIVFDEMDQRLTFNQRPANIQLPELDNLRSKSFFATNAYPPAPLTYMSMPALITGRLVAQVTPVRADELMVRFDGEREGVAWSSQPNVFAKARSAGYSTGLAGWCHPYCEVIGDNLSKCAEVKEKTSDEISLGASMFAQAEGLISTIPLVQQTSMPVVQRVSFINEIVTKTERRKYTIRYKHVLDSSLKAAVDPSLDLVFVHSPVPHPPGIYDSSKNDFSLESRNGYADNLELVDRTIGELRKALENSGLWDKTTIIITADHWWRSEMWSRGPFWTPGDARVAGNTMDHRIPFLVKLAGSDEQHTYQTGFNTVVTHDLVLAIMKGEIQHPADLAKWIDRNRTIADSPYNRDELLP